MSQQDELDLQRLETFKAQLESDGFYCLRVVEGRGICGLMNFIFTVGLCEGIGTNGFDFYEGRYCYPHQHNKDAFMALMMWDGKGDPKGRWLKYKGKRGEYHKEPEKHIL